jgi:hypothetical protein
VSTAKSISSRRRCATLVCHSLRTIANCVTPFFQLAEVEQWEERVVELEKLLGPEGARHAEEVDVADTSSVADSEAVSETDSTVAVAVTESMLEA